jgi:hypothetical protein
MLYRSANLSERIIDDYKQAYRTVACWKSFSSTTKKKEVAMFYDGNAIFQIRVSEHMMRPNADITFFSQYPEEEEVLLCPGTWMHIEEVEFDSELNKHIINLSM